MGRFGAFMVIVQVIVGGLLLGAIYALFSSGLTLIWGMMNFINFAHGEFVMLGMYVAFLVRGLAARRAAGLCACRGFGSVRARRRHLCVADPPRDPRADAVADPLDLRAGAAACATARSLSFRRISSRCRRIRSPAPSTRRHFSARRAARRRRGRDHADARAASSAHPHHRRQHASCRGGGPRRRDADGHPARPHAGAGLGPVGGRGGDRRRA